MFGNTTLKNIVTQRMEVKALPDNGTINSDATMEELSEVVFFVGLCRGYTWGIYTQLSQSRVEWKSSLEAGSLRQPKAENVVWQRCEKWRGPNYSKSL